VPPNFSVFWVDDFLPSILDEVLPGVVGVIVHMSCSVCSLIYDDDTWEEKVSREKSAPEKGNAGVWEMHA
jgi:hypothetical protein